MVMSSLANSCFTMADLFLQMKFKVAYEIQILTDSSLVGKTQSNSARKITMKFVRGPTATSGLRTRDIVRMKLAMFVAILLATQCT